MILLVFHSFLPFSSSPISHFDIAMEIFAMSFVLCVQRSLILLNAGHSVNCGMFNRQMLHITRPLLTGMVKALFCSLRVQESPP